MQSVSSRIWTRVAASISYDDEHYTKGTYKFLYLWNVEIVECEREMAKQDTAMIYTTLK